jgi:predicted RNase H-like HicB family nuclease
MELDYTYFEADEGGFIGYFNDFPQHVTEGETLEELEEMLLDMFECLHPPRHDEIKEFTAKNIIQILSHANLKDNNNGYNEG